MSRSAVRVVYGAASIGYPAEAGSLGIDLSSDKTAIDAIFKDFRKRGHDRVDTARAYAGSERLLGEINYKDYGLVVDTKVVSFVEKAHTKEMIAKSVKGSLEELKTNKVNILYLHAPDRSVPFAETLQALNEEYKKGHFEKLGLSNYSAEQVEEIVKIAKENGYVSPSVYQGQYNVLARQNEDVLFPVLRRHNIGFYAYSPLGGSFLTDSPNERFDATSLIGTIYNSYYSKDGIFKARDQLKETATKSGVAIDELVLRWIAHHSLLNAKHDDAIIIGSKNPANVKRTLDALDKGPLSEDAVQSIEKIWQQMKSDAPQYHM